MKIILQDISGDKIESTIWGNYCEAFEQKLKKDQWYEFGNVMTRRADRNWAQVDCEWTLSINN